MKNGFRRNKNGEIRGRLLSRTFTTTKHEISLWRKLFAKWPLTLTVGIGVPTFLTVLQRTYATRSKQVEKKGIVDNIMVECYCCLPLRITSRVWGWVASIEVPSTLRPTLYGYYAKLFSANLSEIDIDLSRFPTLVDFFVRPLKKDARPIATNTNLVIPADGKVLHFGPVQSCRVEQVKGVTYDLRHFLGMDNDKDKKKSSEEFVKELLINPNNRLYQLTVYLAPGDYHRFHSPADWTIEKRVHFQGKLLSVNPRIAAWLPNLFTLNERVVYMGKWSRGFMAYVAIGATNVGSIRVYRDPTLTTNKRMWPSGKEREDAVLPLIKISKGELFGEFRMGSTIVLLFEAPKNLNCDLFSGQSVHVGQNLANSFV